MELQLQSHAIELDPASRELLEHSAARLDGRYPDFLLRLHATVRRTPHHRTGSHTVTLLANVKGGVLRAEKVGREVWYRPDPAPVRAALDAVEDYLRSNH